MKNRTAKFLIFSIAGIFALCVVAFSLMTYLMNRRGSEAIGKLGALYMSGMSEQAATHFGTAIELRLSQVNALTAAVPPSSDQSPDATYVSLTHNARLRGFTYLALYGQDGAFEMLYGSDLKVDYPDRFLQTLRDGEENMSSGSDKDEKELVLMGIPAAYPMSSGKKSLALVAALPITYISDTLSLDVDNTMLYYFIIDREGNFIIRDSDVTDESYTQRVLDRYETVNGMSGEQYLTELRAAMEDNRNYTNEFTIEGERRFLYGTSLPFSDWYLLLFMPYGAIDQTVNALGNSWVIAAVTSCSLILIALGTLFAMYYQMTRKHMRELEEARHLAEHASKAKSEFLSNMSHDIRTPMNGIIGMTAIAIANIGEPRQVENCLKKIDLSSRYLLGLINDILDMSKIESGKLELHPDKVSLQELFTSVLNIVRPQAVARSQRLDVCLRDIRYENIVCDGVRFSQILLNLLNNAVKFTPEGGEISLGCAEESSPRGEGYTRLRLCVKDTGIGMSEEFRKKIFDAFSREDTGRVQKTEGTGLGMAIAKYIVDAMGGTIEVDSCPDQGTEFRVVLDCEKAGEEEWAPLGLDLLAVEIDGQRCGSLEDALLSFGCRPVCVPDGEAALKAIGERGENAFSAVLLCCDPEVSDPLACRIAEASGGQSAILLLTSADRGETVSAADAVGISAVLPEPIFRSDLYEALKRCTDTSEPSSGAGNAYRFEGKRVLLAEDNDLNREIAQELLSGLGLEIDAAEDGKICADKFAASPVGWYDAVLMDIRMPVMSGYEATEAIRAMDRPDAKSVPIIAMSADAFSDDVRRCLDHGMDHHIAKPIDMDVVSRVLARFLYPDEEKDKKG